MDAAVLGVLEQPPVELARLRPLRLLAQLDAHEDELLAGVGPHVGQVGAQVGQLLPAVSGHLAQHRALAVHDLVVAQRQHVVLRPGVDQGEGHVAVVVRAVDGVALEVAQGVVHPAHVPLEAEAETAVAGGAGDTGPGGGLLGDGDHAGHPLVDGGVHLLQELHRLEVLAAAVLVGQPLAVVAGVVEVEHRGDAVDAQAVGVELLEPVERVGVEEVTHLVAPEVEDVGAPLGVPAAARVGVLVEGGAVELGQRPLIGGEVARHPVEDDADAGLVQPVDEALEAVGVAEAGVGGEVGGDVVAPRAAERVLHHRHQLHVGEAELGDVGHEGVGQLVPGVEALVVVLAPGPEVHLVGGHGGGHRLLLGAGGHPVRVAPGVGGLVHAGGGERWHLGVRGQRVGLVAPVPVGAEDGVLVGGAGGEPGHEELPHAGGAELAHGREAAVPAVELGGEPHGARVGCPHRERRAGDRLGAGRLVVVDPRPEDLPEVLVAALADQVEVHLAERGQEAVGVVLLDRVAVPGDEQAVLRHVGGGEHTHEDALVLVLERRLLPRRRAVGAPAHHDARGQWP